LSFNSNGAVDVGLDVFSGWVTELDEVDLMLGLSPDCPNCSFLPSSVFTRNGVERVFNPPLAPGTTINYAKSYVSPDGTIFNFYLSSNGAMYLQNITAGTPATVLFTTPSTGSYARSVTEFGREIIAINDGLHGSEVPLQFDGTNLDRVSQNGPGTPPTVTSVALPAVSMAATGNTLTRQNNYVTGVTAAPNNLKVGYQVQISNVPDSNSTSVVQSNTSSNQVVNGSVWDLNGGQYRSLFNPGTSALSDFVAQGFGFTIPGSATILGVTVTSTLQSQSATTGTVSQVALWFSGSQIGTAKSPATPITTTATATSYGSAADLWGAALTPAIVNDPSFGFAMACNLDSVRAFIDFPFTVQVFYTLSGSGTVANVTSIVINNETNPGLALVTTDAPHGLIPDIFVSIVGVEPGAVASIAAAQWVAGVTTLTTETSHNLTPGAVVQVAGVTTAATPATTFSFNGTFSVLSVPSPNQVTYVQVPITATDPDVINATANTGNITLSWPIPDNTPTPTYFEVVSAPTSTTFYIQVNYADGTWTSGTVGFIWEGIFPVTAILSPTTFQYYQQGPNGATTAVGTVTPWGQAAPGAHLVRQSFLTRQGYLTKPSPWVQFIANGGQYLQCDDLAIGPANIVARVLEFSGALGSLFYYIPVPAQVNGIVVSTATQINDNTTTSILLDFSDNTLFASIGTSIPGNNTPAQITIDGALGFFSFDTMLVTWGQRNIVNGLLNMDFDGGFIGTNRNPTGWTVSGTGGGCIGSRFNGFGWQIFGPGMLSQSFYADGTGAPIAEPNTFYSVRFWVVTEGTGPQTITFTITSASTGFASAAPVTVTPVPGTGEWVQVNFPIATPETIPQDLMFNINYESFAGSEALVIDEVNVFFTETPYTDQVFNASYGNNPEAFDGITGIFGPSDDQRKVMDIATIRDIPYILTLEPSGRLHEVAVTGTTLPSGWQVNEVGSNCGVLSAYSMTRSQSDDGSASGGEEWFAWGSESGARIFGGNQPWKISQEIQPNWHDYGDQNQINMAAALTSWTLNDPVERLLYFGLPTGTNTQPDQMYVMSYREMDTAESIAMSPPYRSGFSGKMIASDAVRKWSRWPLAFNSAARIYLNTSEYSTVFGAGLNNFGNIYVLNPDLSTDDDFGQIVSYYTTCPLPNHEQEQSLQLGAGRHLMPYLSAYISGIGSVVITAFFANLNNPWPLTCTRTLSLNPKFDLEWTAGSLEAQRIFFRIQPFPLPGTTDARFNLNKFTPYIRKSRIPARGAAQ
jgi:hypothetical protein